MIHAKDMTSTEEKLKEQVDTLKKETLVLQAELKQLLLKNDEVKQSFACMLDKFQDYVNSGESSQEQMRATIKRLSVENQRLRVNSQIEAKDLSKERRGEVEEAMKQVAALTQENTRLKQ